MARDVVPFGKYKGQPVEVLAADRDYCDWLAAQPWFRERFRDVYNVVVQMPGEPQDSPEHNALQARFLDDALCVKLWRHLNPEDAAHPLVIYPSIERREFEVGGVDVLLRMVFPDVCREHLRKNKHIDFNYITPHLVMAVEVKPAIGDDYPSVLRQVIRTREAGQRSGKLTWGTHLVVVTEAYTGTGATLEQARAIYAGSGVSLLLMDDFA